MWSENFFMGGMWFFPPLGLLIMVSVLYLIFGQRADSSSSEDSALDILKKRYAKGEISK